MLSFPDTFLWGAATAAYQIEGSPLADGAGPSIWHRFAHTRGNVRGGAPGDVAADHYGRWREDLALMKELGLDAYRFSVAWPRVMPAGTGAVNQAGLAFYDRLVDGLMAAGISPVVTLYHWDLPAALQDRGGFCNQKLSDWMAAYAATVFSALGDRVHFWITLNEPFCVAHLGHVTGEHAPGMRDLEAGLRASCNALRAHGAAVRAFRASGREGIIGPALSCTPVTPASDTDADAQAASLADAYHNRLYLDAILKGSVPAELPARFGRAWPEAFHEDRELIASPVDFVGVNYYTRMIVTHDPKKGILDQRVLVPRGAVTAMGWEIWPDGLAALLSRLRDEYGNPPVFVTESGAAFHGHAKATAADPERIAYLDAHIRRVHAAMAEGCDLRGYFVWALMDNVEWALGTSRRFGLIHVDFRTGRRTIRPSGRWYGEVIARRGIHDG